MTETTKTYWFAKGGRRLAQPINAQGWTVAAAALVLLIGGAEVIIAMGVARFGLAPCVIAAMIYAGVVVLAYFAVVEKLTDKDRSPESYWEEQEKARKK